jgi:hypothetical protein
VLFNGCKAPSPGGFAFVQISDTHVGFRGDANAQPVSTLRVALDRIANATGDRRFDIRPLGEMPVWVNRRICSAFRSRQLHLYLRKLALGRAGE